MDFPLILLAVVIISARKGCWYILLLFKGASMRVSSNNLIQINLGPQHPSTHGVLRIIAYLESEVIKSLEVDLGLLHRGSEKLIE